MKKLLLRVTLMLFCYAIFGTTNGYAQVKFGNSYVNLSKKTAGGTVEPGDTLEIRTCYYFPGGYNSGNVYFARYMDNVPTNTTFIDDSIRLITNEGLLVKRYTLAGGDDAAAY
ncbi:MAG: hypothetical protein J7578_16445, partial [Chitinophagaceae bacterium]|nr:hypothetical protein [Chitinophagaceae bacterium]